MSTEDLIRKVLKQVGEMPPLPDVVTKVMQMTKDPDVSASQLNKVISMDQSLTANILKLCNSAYYGLPRIISSVTQAVMYLGFHTVRNLVMTCTMHQMYGGEMKGYGYEEGFFWRHSISVALGSQVICKKVRPGLNDTAFTAGLLHDLGKMILSRVLPEEIEKVVSQTKEEQQQLFRSEFAVFGFDHAYIGARIADQWNFPPELIQAIGYHHQPEKAKGRPLLAAIVNVGDLITLRLGLGSSHQEGIPAELSEYSKQALGISDDDMDALVAELEKVVEDASQFLRPTG